MLTTETPRGDHLRLDITNPYAGAGAMGAFAKAAIEAREKTFKDLHEVAKADAEAKAENGGGPTEESPALNEAVATQLKDAALADAEAKEAGEGDDPETPWTEGGPFDPVSMEANNALAEDLQSEAQASADAKDEEQPNPDPGDGSFDVTATSFSAELDPVVTVNDASRIDDGDTVTLTATNGDATAMGAIDGQSGAIYGKSGNTFKMPGIDLSTMDVTGLTANVHVVPVPDTSGTITAFTSTNPTVVTMDGEDQSLLTVGNNITLEAKAGETDAMATIDGVSAKVLSISPTTLQLDLSTVDVTGLVADFSTV